MRGSAIVFGTEAICVSAFVGCCARGGGATAGLGGGGAAQAASRATATKNRAFMGDRICKNIAQAEAKGEISNFKFQMKN